MTIIPSNEDLSEREREILRLLATGMSNKEIASQLTISANTVKVHVRNIFVKIGASTRTEAAMYAVKAGLVAPALAALTPPAGAETGLDAGETLEAINPGHSTMDEALDAPVIVRPEAPPAPAQGRGRAWRVGAAALGAVMLLLVVYAVWRAGQNPAASPPAVVSDPARWKALAPLQTARFSPAAVAYEGFIYAMGGQTAQGATSRVERYDPTRDTWLYLADKPTPVYEATAGVLAGEVFVPGGRLTSGQPSSILEVYDPRHDHWRQAQALPIPLSAYALAVFEGRLYLFGGWDGSRFVDTVYRYDLAQDSWTLAAHLPAPRAYAGAAAVGRRIYVIGGYDGTQALNENLIYQPDLEGGNVLWEEAGPLPTGRYGMGVASIAEMINVVGGIQSDHQNFYSFTYFPFTNEWQAFRGLEDRTPQYPGVVAVGNFLYILGGQLEGQPVAQNLAYQAVYTVSFPIIR